MSYCKLCFYIQLVNSKFTIWHTSGKNIINKKELIHLLVSFRPPFKQTTADSTSDLHAQRFLLHCWRHTAISGCVLLVWTTKSIYQSILLHPIKAMFYHRQRMQVKNLFLYSILIHIHLVAPTLAKPCILHV